MWIDLDLLYCIQEISYQYFGYFMCARRSLKKELWKNCEPTFTSTHDNDNSNHFQMSWI